MTDAAFNRHDSDGIGVHTVENPVWFNKNQTGSFPLPHPSKPETSHYPEYLAHVRALIAELDVAPQRVVCTIVPDALAGASSRRGSTDWTRWITTT